MTFGTGEARTIVATKELSLSTPLPEPVPESPLPGGRFSHL
jgi:hypothetical protein